MIAKTPLLVPDGECVQEDANGHKTYQLLVGSDGKPLIPASSVRGMLRSAYEAVTNSRFGRFSREQHGDRLAFRMAAGESLLLIPARVEKGKIRLLTGTSYVGNGRPNGPMYAAWLPRYDRNGQVANWAIRYRDRQLPQHGDEVVCWIEEMQHLSPNFVFWRVREIARGCHTSLLANQPNPSNPRGNPNPAEQPQMKKVCGWVCVTNANIKGKHDERVFFSQAVTGLPGPFNLTNSHVSQWQELIRNYQSIHEEELTRRRKLGQEPDQYLPPKPGQREGQAAWSRHVYTPDDKELVEGTLCYVRLNESGTDVDALFPVMIDRELYPDSPWNLLDVSLKPAAAICELSPADRVFGWVKSDYQNLPYTNSAEGMAVRSLLRVGPVICESSMDDAIQRFPGAGVPLAILSTPKPQQGRFYVANSPKGEAQQNSISKIAAGYTKHKGLRGRKVYPHHAGLPDGYWNEPTQDRTQEGCGNPTHYQEYRRPQKNNQEQRDDQNRSMRAWVKPGAQFTFEVQVRNLSEVELGALLWLLKRPKEHFFRFGGGKPLGFGSVRLTIESCNLCTGQNLIAQYEGWHTPAAPADPCVAPIRSFEKALHEAYPPPAGSSFESIPFIAAFLTACGGFNDGLPIHYPRATEDSQPGPPSPEGESFKWFIANERGLKLALPDLAKDTGLPTL